MHTSLYLLIAVSLLAGFSMRPLNMFVFSTVFSLVKYTRSKPQIILLGIATVLTTIAVSMSTIFLSLKLTGFIPLAENTPIFAVSFFVGGALWVVYAKKFNLVCRIE